MFSELDTDSLPPDSVGQDSETALPATDTTAQAAPAPVAPAPASRTSAGVALLLAGSGAVAGWLMGGGWGAGAGLLLVGAARNGYRAKSLWTADRAEAAKCATMAVAGAAGGGYLAYRAVKGKKRR